MKSQTAIEEGRKFKIRDLDTTERERYQSQWGRCNAVLSIIRRVQ